MEFKYQEIKDWVLENHKKYWESEFPVDKLYPILSSIRHIEEEWGFIIQHMNGEYFLRILFLDLDNYTDFYDYPIGDYKMWLRDRKLNEILNE